MARLIVLTCAMLFAWAARAEPLTIRVGWSTMPGHMIPVLFSKPGILKHMGTSYRVQTISFRGSSPQITAMAAREVDLTASSPATLALSITNARLDLRVVADIIQDGVPGYLSETFLVRADSGINTVADLRGKRMGTNALGSAADTAMRAMLSKAGLLDKRDFITVEAAFPALPALLEEGKIDMTVVLQPASRALQASGKYRVLFRARDAWGPTQLVFLVGRSDFLDKNRAVMEDFIEDYLRAMRWFTAPENRAEATATIAAFMKVDEASLSYLFTKDDYFRDPFGVPNIPALQTAIDTTKELGLIPAGVQVAPKYVDTSFVETARKRIEATP